MADLSQSAKKLRTPEAASYLGLSPRTLEKLRVSGRGPSYYKLGTHAVRYSLPISTIGSLGGVAHLPRITMVALHDRESSIATYVPLSLLRPYGNWRPSYQNCFWL